MGRWSGERRVLVTMLDTSSSGSDVPRGVECGLRCWLLTALGVLLAGVALYDFRLGQDYGFLRVQCLVAEIVAGVGMAWCWGGAMHYVDGALAARERRWYGKLLWLTHKRVLLVGQLIGAVVMVLAVGALIFDKPIPAPDQSAIYPEATWPAK